MGSAEGPHREQAHPKCLFHISALPLSPPEQTPSGPRAHRRSGGDARVGDAAEPELGRQTGHPSPPAEPGAPSPHPRSECSLQLAAPAGPGPRLAEPRPRRPSPGLRRPPFLPGHSPRAAGAATARRAHSHPSASSCRSSWSSERSAPRGEKKGPVSAPGTRRAAPAARPPDPAAPPRAETPRRPRVGAAAGGPARGGGAAAARRTGGHVPAILWSPPPPRSPGDPGLHGAERAGEPGSARGRGGKEEGPAGGGARGFARGAGRGPGPGPRAERLPGAGGGWAPRAPGLAPPRPAVSRGSRAAGGPSSRLPRSRPGPAARAHTLGRRRPHAERCDGRAQAARRPGTLRRVPGTRPGRGLPRPGRLYWVTGLAHRLVGRGPSSRARLSPPRAPSPGLHVRRRRSEAR